MAQEQTQDEQDQDQDQSEGERAGLHDKPSDEEIKEIEEERERRLDPDNRPENAEIDNTNRTFEDGGFKD